MLRVDLLTALIRGEKDIPVSNFRREITTIPGKLPILNSIDKLLYQRAHIMLVVDEYGSMLGILTLEDVLETMLGLEIVDESDSVTDMQELARRFWRLRQKPKI